MVSARLGERIETLCLSARYDTIILQELYKKQEKQLELYIQLCYITS